VSPASGKSERSFELLTIGHSSHSLEQFLALLRQHDVQALVDIRRFPGSRTFPHFNRERLAPAVGESGIEYHWLESLGGRRSKRASDTASPNAGLRNASFRHYADYMLTDEFRAGFEQLEQIAAEKRTTIMCSESVFWRCHRRLVSDYVTALGGAVRHIFPNGEVRPHALTAGAKLSDGSVIYPSEPGLFE
jgi:uncharacterized protein (DUF488 family)